MHEISASPRPFGYLLGTQTFADYLRDLYLLGTRRKDCTPKSTQRNIYPFPAARIVQVIPNSRCQLICHMVAAIKENPPKPGLIDHMVVSMNI